MGVMDDIVRPWWLKPQIFIVVLLGLGLSVSTYAIVTWAINKYAWELLASFLAAFS